MRPQVSNDVQTNTIHISESAQKKTAAQRSKNYRDKIKQDPEKYITYLEREKERNRKCRENWSSEQKIHQREKTRLRVRKWREERKPEEIVKLKKKTKPKTRAQVSSQREYWQRKKEEQRAKYSSQKRRRINEKRRLQYKLDKSKSTTENLMPAESTETHQGYSTKEAERKAIYRASLHLPSSPEKFASVVGGLTAKATPRKREALTKHGLLLTPTKKRHLRLSQEIICKMKDDLHKTRKHRTKEVLKKRRLLTSFILKDAEKRKAGISWKFAVKCSKLKDVWEEDSETPKRSDALTEDTIDKIEKFYKDFDTVCLPDKKQASLKSEEPKRILQSSLRDNYNEFLKENQECTLSFSKFTALRPKTVQTMSKSIFNNCLCEYCTNIQYKVKALNMQGIKTRYELLSRTVCPKPEGSRYYKIECVKRLCKLCGVDKFISQLDLYKRHNIQWYKWETQTYMYANEKKSKKVLSLKKESVSNFLEELKKELQPFSAHLNTAWWQHDQFRHVTQNLPSDWTVFCSDFAENYTCLYQDEAQSAHWSHDTVTLFSIVAYIRCKFCELVVTQSMIYVSEDKKHDVHYVQHCISLANEYIQRVYEMKSKRQIHFSDGAASQFKSKTPFADALHSKSDFGFPVEKHFFGSRHGKGPCDGEFGVIKRIVTNAVKNRKAMVKNASEFFDFAEANLRRPTLDSQNECCHFRRNFFIVKEGDVNRKRPERTNVKAVPETRQLHSVRAADDSASLEKRTLSCFCSTCIQGSGSCHNADMVEGWIKETQRRQLNKKDTSKKSKKVDKKNVKGLLKETPRKQRATRSNSHKTADSQERSQDSPNQKEFNRQDTTVEEVHSVFDVILQTLKSCTSIDDIMIKGTELASVIPNLRCNKDEDISISGSGLHIDKFGMELLPDDVKKEGYFPASVLGDGNCLPRSASVIMYGTENNHTELRARIALELACYLPLYVDHTYLRRGEQLSDKEALVLPKSYVMYSELYTPGDIITSSLIERTLFEEIRKVCSANEFMGIWQLFALASVLGRPLQSVYPNRGNPNVRKDLNRSILPREMESNTPAYILWSSNRNDEMTYAHWIPNHFCPILKMSINDDVLEYSTDTLGDIDLENISGLSEQLAPWVMDLLDDSDSEVSNNQYNMVNISIMLHVFMIIQ